MKLLLWIVLLVLPVSAQPISPFNVEFDKTVQLSIFPWSPVVGHHGGIGTGDLLLFAGWAPEKTLFHLSGDPFAFLELHKVGIQVELEVIAAGFIHDPAWTGDNCQISIYESTPAGANVLRYWIPSAVNPTLRLGGHPSRLLVTPDRYYGVSYGYRAGPLRPCYLSNGALTYAPSYVGLLFRVSLR